MAAQVKCPSCGMMVTPVNVNRGVSATPAWRYPLHAAPEHPQWEGCPMTGKTVQNMSALSAFEAPRPGDRVEVLAGEDAGATGTVRSSDGAYVVVDLADGSLRTSAENVVKMGAEVSAMGREDEREAGRKRLAEKNSVLQVGDRVRYVDTGETVTVTAVDGMILRIKFPNGQTINCDRRNVRPTEMAVSMANSTPWSQWFASASAIARSDAGLDPSHPDVSVALRREYDAGKSPDDAVLAVARSMMSAPVSMASEVKCANGHTVKCGIHGKCPACGSTDFRAMSVSAVSMARSAKCPYCARTVAMSASTLGDHRVAGGPCEGSRRAVASLDSVGRAVLMARYQRSKAIDDQITAAIIEGGGWANMTRLPGGSDYVYQLIQDGVLEESGGFVRWKK